MVLSFCVFWLHGIFCKPLSVGHETISSCEPSGTAALEKVLEVCISDLALAVGGLVFILLSKQREFTEGLDRNPSISQKDSRTHRLMLKKNLTGVVGQGSGENFGKRVGGMHNLPETSEMTELWEASPVEKKKKIQPQVVASADFHGVKIIPLWPILKLLNLTTGLQNFWVFDNLCGERAS